MLKLSLLRVKRKNHIIATFLQPVSIREFRVLDHAWTRSFERNRVYEITKFFVMEEDKILS